MNKAIRNMFFSVIGMMVAITVQGYCNLELAQVQAVLFVGYTIFLAGMVMATRVK
jgi:hypothetical protein